MEWGMMWHTGEKAKNKKEQKEEKTFRDKLINGIDFFREKYDYHGLVDVRVLKMEEFEPIPNVNVQSLSVILPDTLWIGVNKGDFRKKDDVDGEN